jgi:triosephosphate isomerase
MRRALVAGNWKMNGSGQMARELTEAISSGIPPGVDVALFPPFPYLTAVAERVREGVALVGAQDVSEHAPGAFTGDVAAEMLVDCGCSMVLVGHSERRQGLGESDGRVGAKFVQAMDAGLVPILCVGETLAERAAKSTTEVVIRQLDAVFSLRPAADLGPFVLAYEPVWAIGTGETASPQQAQDVHAVLRERIRAAGGDGEDTRIVYGGSVKPGNAPELFAMADIDGGLIGGAALDAAAFLAICQAAGD